MRLQHTRAHAIAAACKGFVTSLDDANVAGSHDAPMESPSDIWFRKKDLGLGIRAVGSLGVARDARGDDMGTPEPLGLAFDEVATPISSELQ